ncbi:MAG: RagB/SusD family nutrient uptake outer membrane protein [Bacteroidales bacterium]
MKSIYRKCIYLFSLSLLLFTSCQDMLDEVPLDFINQKQFFKNEAQCEAAANGCYGPLNSIFNQTLLIPLEACSDLAYLDNKSYEDVSFSLSPASPGNGKSLWSSLYYAIRLCNGNYDGILRADIDEKKKGQYMAEIAFLRGLYYYTLTSTFGDIPFYTDDVCSLEILKKVSALPRMSASETRDSLIGDLSRLIEYLPKRVPAQNYSRIPRQAAHMLIAKMAMWNKDYALAFEHLTEIRLIYGHLSQYSLEDTKFSEKNKPESIFEVQYTYSATGLRKTSSTACYFTPYKNEKDKAVYDGLTIPYLGTKASPFTSLRPSKNLIELYEAVKAELSPEAEGIDPRSRIIMGYGYKNEEFNSVKNGNKPWMGPKFWCPGMDNMSDGNNQKVFRFADALLMLAECANELGKQDLALECLKEVRQRALYGMFFENRDPEAIRKEIRDERARELMGEYGRRWDLVRWGIFYESIKNTTGTEIETIGKNIKPFHQYYPIPDTEVQRTNGILTNDAYNQ